MLYDDDGNVLRCEVAAGGKHQASPAFRHYCQDWLLEYSRSHGLAVEDNNRNEENRFQYRRDWTLAREEHLKQELKCIKANRKKLEQIVFRCESATDRRIYKDEYLKKAAHFREKWNQKLQQEDALTARIRELHALAQAMKWEATQKERASL